MNEQPWTTGKAGNALQFDGADDHASVSSIDLSATNKVSVAFFMYKETFNNDDDLAMELTANNNNFQTGFMLDPNSGSPYNGYYQICARGNNGNNCAGYIRPSAGTWHYYVAVLDKGQLGNNEVNLYIDGVLQTAAARNHNSDNTN